MAAKVTRYVAGMLVMLSCALGNAPTVRADILAPPKYYNDIKFVAGSSAFYVNQKPALMDVPPFIAGGRAYLPVRSLLEAIGIPDGKITWDASTQSVAFPYRAGVGDAPRDTIRIGDRQVYYYNGEKAAFLDAPPVMEKGRVFVPVRLTAELFRCTVAWNAAERSVTVNVPVF